MYIKKKKIHEEVGEFQKTNTNHQQIMLVSFINHLCQLYTSFHAVWVTSDWNYVSGDCYLTSSKNNK